MAGSVFAITYSSNIPLMIVFAIPGFIGWILPYLMFSRIKAKKTIELVPLIEEKYDEAYEITKRANTLLATDSTNLFLQ